MNLWLLTQALNVTLIMRAKTFSVNQLETFLLVCVCVNIFCSKTTEGGSFTTISGVGVQPNDLDF